MSGPLSVQSMHSLCNAPFAAVQRMTSLPRTTMAKSSNASCATSHFGPANYLPRRSVYSPSHESSRFCVRVVFSSIAWFVGTTSLCQSALLFSTLVSLSPFVTREMLVRLCSSSLVRAVGSALLSLRAPVSRGLSVWRRCACGFLFSTSCRLCVTSLVRS